MPYYTFYDDMLEDLNDEITDANAAELEMPEAGVPQYEPASATYNFQNGERVTNLIHSALVRANVDTVYIKYDGGNDEGFSHFDSAQRGGVDLKLEELMQLIDKQVVIAALEKGFGERMHESTRNYYSSLSEQKFAAHMLDEFVEPLAVALLGEGYGTGEFELRGRCKVNLQSEPPDWGDC